MNSSNPSLDDVQRFRVNAARGDCLFEQGDSGEDMYLIESGSVELVVHVGSDERQLAKLEQGDFFGEMSLLDKLPRECTARVVEDCRLLRLDSSTFDLVAREVPEIPVRMLRKLARVLRHRLEDDARAAKLAWGAIEPPAKGMGADPAALTGTEALDSTGGEEAPPVPDAVLLVSENDREFRLSSSDETTVGRPDPATGLTPDIDLSGLEHSLTLSRRHAQIRRGEDGFYVTEEVGTSNGTFVNERRIDTGVPVKLNQGDHVRFGLVDTVFREQ